MTITAQIKDGAPMVVDSLRNLVSGMGTGRDKGASSFYDVPMLSPQEAMNAYRGSWLPQKIVNIPAQDATRKWRQWQADKPQIQELERVEKALALRLKVRDVMIKARLMGGAAIYIAIKGDTDLSKPINVDRLGKDCIAYLTVLTPNTLAAGEYENDPVSPNYGKPKFYTAGGSAVTIHPSRLAVFYGAQVPEDGTGSAVTSIQGWGDSVLTAIIETIKQSDSTMANIASLVFEANVDVIQIPQFMAQVNQAQYREKVLTRLQLAATAKGINKTLVMDADEKYTRHAVTFSGLPDVSDRFLQAVCGAADIPATRLLGQTAKGLGNDGDGDMRNYYDRVQSMQELDVSPALTTLDECLIRHALGKRDPKIHYVWASLWQSTPEQRATNGKTIAETVKIIAETNTIPGDALAKAVQTTLVEHNVFPGLEAALVQYGSEVEEEPDTGPALQPLPRGQQVADAAALPLYVQRKVLNVAEIAVWAKSQGLKLDDKYPLHIIIAYSRTPVDWMKAGQSWGQDGNGNLTIEPGGPRMLDKFDRDGSALVLLVASYSLESRHRELLELGASWDHAEYQPHMTISYDAAGVDISTLQPYRGKIELGPEIFEEIKP